MSLNPNIRRVVEMLNANGFRTTDSGDGATHDHACDRSYAYVTMLVEPNDLVAEAHRLVALLAKQGITAEPQNEDDTPAIQASYDPCNGVAILDLHHVTDNMLPTEQATP